jgi:tripartite-type tricarboxylate transporter receptor subunit TctC
MQASRILAACLGTVAVATAVTVAAQAVTTASAYPTKPVRILVPTPPGGGNDIMARMAAQKMNERWSQAVVVDNRPGAGGQIAMETSARATPDGYTLLLGTTNLTVLPSMTKVAYDPVRDFVPVSLMATSANLLLIHPGVEAKSLQQLLALARAKPGQLNYASGSVASSTQLAAELMKSMARVDITHVPYKGAGPALVDLLAGQVQMMFSNPAASAAHVRSGKLRALAATSEKRLPDFPELPTVAESGLPGYEASTWWGILAPRGTPAPIVTQLNEVISNAISAGDVRSRIAALGAQPAGGPPQQLVSLIRDELPKWTKVIKEAGIRLE